MGNSELTPLWSDYDKTVWYNQYDVTGLCQGASASNTLTLQVLLGNGFYNEQGGRYHKMKISFGPPTLLLRLHIDYANGKSEDIVSDASWQYALSAITFNSIYGGEDYDARWLPVWKPVVVQEAPRGQLRPQLAEPVRIMEKYKVAQRLPHNVFDMGQNLAGFPQITVRGKAGQRVRLIVGESLGKDGHIDQRQTGRPHYYTYILKGDGDETWHPRFSYYGFRYVEVETEAELIDLKSCFIYNSARKTGEFECSNALLNDAARLIDRAVRSNWQGVWTDCPHREKLGWLEQDWLNGEGLVSNYDCRAMIEQTLRNIADAQHSDGAVPTTAPQYTVFPGETWGKPFNESPEWGGALVALPKLFLRQYHDTKLVSEYLPQMVRYVDYLATQADGHILNQGLGDWYDYVEGEKAGFAKNTPVPLVSTAHYYQWTRDVAGFANLLADGNAAAASDLKATARRLNVRADSIREAFNREFYHPDTHLYATGSQCAQAIALDMEMVPQADRQAVLDCLVDDIHRHGDRLTTGDVGNRYLFRVLSREGDRTCNELLYRMLNHYDAPGYGYQIKLGHTTLTEQWNPEHGSSMNHFMMGHLSNLLIPRFVGITVCDGSPSVRIAPMPVGDLTWCKGCTECTQGRISCEWHIKDNRFLLDIDVPQGTAATIVMPYSRKTIPIVSGKHHFEEPI